MSQINGITITAFPRRRWGQGLFVIIVEMSGRFKRGAEGEGWGIRLQLGSVVVSTLQKKHRGIKRV